MAMHATCYLCDEIVYLFKKECKNPSTNSFYKRHLAVVRSGFILCGSCNSDLDKRKQHECVQRSGQK